MTKPPPDWHAEARLMRSEIPQPTISEIARRLGRDPSVIRWVLNEKGEREQTRIRARRCKGYDMAGRNAATIDIPARHQPHTARRLLADPQTKREALQLFARGEIGREELMRRITA